MILSEWNVYRVFYPGGKIDPTANLDPSKKERALQLAEISRRTHFTPVSKCIKGNLRADAVKRRLNLMVEDVSDDDDGGVRFAIEKHEDAMSVFQYLSDVCQEILPGAKLVFEQAGVVNPILSELRCNDESQYTTHYTGTPFN